MKAKEKANKKQKKYIKRMLKSIFIFSAFLISLLDIFLFYNYYSERNKVYASETISYNTQEVKISKAQEVDLEKIIEQNVPKAQKEEYIVEEKVLEYITKYRNNENLPKGKIQVVQEGREGKQEITTKKIYQQEELIAQEQVSCKITKASVDKIVEVGTSNYESHHLVKIGDKLCVTSDRLSVMLQPNEQSQKIATLTKENELILLKIENDTWYKISCNSIIGYVKADSTTYLNKYETQENQKQDTSTTQSKAQLMRKLNFDMPLNQPSGLTLEQFKKVLTDSKDVNKIFENQAQYFYYIEQQYHINGIFVAAVGIHESAWGTSQIAQEKNNLFGYGAYDANPYNGAYHFSDYPESIDLMARVFVKYYIQPKGTSIYGGEKALGTYYYTPTLKGVNTKYATDKNWANAVYQHIKYLYNKL